MEILKVGDVINEYKILELDSGLRNNDGKILIKCICVKCNENIEYLRKYDVLTYRRRCPICYQKYVDSFIGKVFEKLTVLEYIGKDKYNHALFKCQCSCEDKTIKNVLLHNLTSGNTTSCGCNGIASRIKHGLAGSKLERRYNSIKRRCYSPKSDAYYNYGGRGIRMSDEWYNSVVNFYNDMIQSYEEHVLLHGEENTTIDRIDVNGNYCKENCKWATRKEQGNNKRNNIYINLYGINYTIEQVSEMYNIPRGTVSNKYYDGTLFNLLDNYTHSKYPIRNEHGKIDVIRFNNINQVIRFL